MAATAEAPTKDGFDIWTTYQSILKDEEISTPLAAILALTELVQRSDAGTMFELVKALNDGAKVLNERTPNPISLNAGCELFIAFVTLFPHDSDSFSDLKKELVKQGQKYANEALTYRQKIARLTLEFIKDDSIILTHSYSRVVMKTLLCAHERKRISVYVTEARPRGLGLRTYEELTAAGIPCTVVLDFRRLSFPLTATPTPYPKDSVSPENQPVSTAEQNASTLTHSQTRYMTQEQIARNPDVDYTRS
ncbi:hypothetical protein BKA83DRAFT_4165300 [Pisolithus microcarpus]|nr:hypothetical protein BKA83DRAFT_4165300 [Pisolithus microcarpus]